MNGMQRLDISC